jgi:hypothetical protein
MEYYNPNIQIHGNVIKDVFLQINKNTKMLVFGLGYDSKMWYEGCNKNVFFIENKQEYINLNIKEISLDKIVKYNYRTTCLQSDKLTDTEIQSFIIPEKIQKEAPFDIIIIDGPEGYSSTTPGRLIPCYWATLLSKPGTIIYIDDSDRYLENYCIQKYFDRYEKSIFKERNGCTKIYI